MARRWFGLLGIAVLSSAAISACGGGGSSGAHRAAKAPAPGGKSRPGAQAGHYQNPAWSLPAPAPATLWTQEQVPPTSEPDWFAARGALFDRSLWAEYGHAGRMPSRDALGAFGLGNGRVFALEGISYPLNTLHGMIGPSYQISSNGFFGDAALGLEIQPWQVTFTDEWVSKVRRAAIVVTKQDAPQVAMWSVDFAPPGIDAIVRQVIVRNKTQQWLPETTVLVKLMGGATAESGRLTQRRGDRKLTIGATPATTTVARDILRVPLGTVAPESERTVLVYFVASKTPQAEQAAIQAIESATPDQLLDATRSSWANFFASGAQIEIPDPKVQDWIDDMLVACALQTAENGNVSPMSRYTKTWMRDSEGPLRLFLRTGHEARVARMLDAYWKTAILSNGIHNSMDADKDLSVVPPAPDWMTAEFMPGRNPVEAPSYIVLNAWEYVRASGDEALVKEQYDFLRAAVLRQERSPQNLMKFNGDEPFRWVLAAALGLYEPENLGWSSNSAFLFVAAAERLGAIAGVLGRWQDQAQFFDLAARVRTATQQNFWNAQEGYYDVCKLFWANMNVWKPFEDISLMPLRIGYGSPKDADMRSNLFYVMQKLGHPDGSVQSSFLTQLANGLAGYDGMVPGYYLANLSLIDHPEAEKAFNRLERVATPSGEVCEGQYAGTDEAVTIQYANDGGPDVVARYRPWEGGICADAALGYLLGTEPDAIGAKVAITPHMPNGWGTLAARGLIFRGEPYDVEVKDFGWRRLVRVTNRGTREIGVDLGISVNALSFGPLFVDGQEEPLPPIDAEFGRLQFRIERQVKPGEWLDVDVQYVR
jgi:hypothetical protein